MRCRIVTVALTLLLAAPALSQDTDAAAERARLANQRIAAEAERRAQEEEQRLEQARAAEVAAPRADPEPPARADAPQEPGGQAMDRADMSRVLEQLRELGELKDAGYVSDDEFARIKQRILDSAL